MTSQDYTRLPSSDTPSPSPRSRRRTWLRLTPRTLFLIVLVAALPLALIVLALSEGSSMRLCLPVRPDRYPSLQRIACSPLNATIAAANFAPSPTHTRLNTHSRATTQTRALSTTPARLLSHSTFSTTSTSTSAMPSLSPTVPGRLADFIQSQNEAFIADLKAGSGKGWHIVMGNEAGDLDSISSAVSYAFLSTALNATRAVALVLTPKSLMHLRPENALALHEAHLPESVLLHPESLPCALSDLAGLGVRFVLVDHNRLLPQFGEHEDAVDVIVDHHEDEGASPNATRHIQFPTGSCSSLVTRAFMTQWKASISGPAGPQGSPVPPELATLLLSSILIDTHGLKPGSKGVDADYAAAAFLYPISTLATPANANTTLTTLGDLGPTGGQVPSPLAAYNERLTHTKFDVTGMSALDLLQRDYKQYAWPTTTGTLEVGLATIPRALKNQLADAGGWAAYLATCDGFIESHGLDVLGGLTTFKSEKKGKSKREILLLVRSGKDISDIAGAQHVLATLGTGLEATGALLDLVPWTGKGKGEYVAQATEALSAPNRVGRVWEQGNAKSTRKQVAPAVQHIVATL